MYLYLCNINNQKLQRPIHLLITPIYSTPHPLTISLQNSPPSKKNPKRKSTPLLRVNNNSSQSNPAATPTLAPCHQSQACLKGVTTWCHPVATWVCLKGVMSPSAYQRHVVGWPSSQCTSLRPPIC